MCMAIGKRGVMTSGVIRFNGGLLDYLEDLPNVLEKLKQDFDDGIIKEVAIVWERSRSSRDTEEVIAKEYFVERYWAMTSIERLLGILEELKLKVFMNDEGLDYG